MTVAEHEFDVDTRVTAVASRRSPATTRFVIDGYHEEDFEIWDSAGRLVAQSRQLALLPSR